MKNFLKIVYIVGLGLSLNSCVGVDPSGRGYSVEVPLSTINNSLASSFPKQENMTLGTLSVMSANVFSQNGKDKLGVGSSFKFSNFLMPDGIKGDVKLSSSFRYDPTSKNLYLSNLGIETLKIQEYSLVDNNLKKAIASVVMTLIEQQPIYNMQKSGFIGNNLVQGVDVREGKVFVTLGL
jgi:hypothetical protein